MDAIVEGTTTPASWQEWQGDGVLPTGKDGLAIVRVCNAIIEAAERQTTIEL